MFNFNFNSNQRRGEVNNKEYYNILNIDKTASHSEIKKAYYKLAKTHHPDKGGDENKFKKIMTAYEILSDKEKREIYDNYGEDGLSEGGNNMNVNPFEHMFPGFRQQGRQSNQKRKGKNVVFELSITLDEIYNGTLKKLKLNKNILCTTCTGNGMKKNKKKNKCSTCNGSGVQVITRRIGPMIQQMQSQCGKCQGEGVIVNDVDKCEKCKGKCVIKTIKILQIHIEKGIKNGEKIIFREESDQNPNTIAGDVIIVIKEEKHKYYRREGLDLWIKKSITLFESLTNYEFVIKHLDGRKLNLHSPTEVTKPNSVKIIENEGMPEFKNPFNKGKLLIRFHVKFPNIMPERYHEILMKIFKKNNQNEHNEEKQNMEESIDENLNLISFDYESYKTEKENQGYNDDTGYQDSDNEYVEVNGCPTQ